VEDGLEAVAQRRCRGTRVGQVRAVDQVSVIDLVRGVGQELEIDQASAAGLESAIGRASVAIRDQVREALANNSVPAVMVYAPATTACALAAAVDP
jgi:hypothetical protein